MNDPFNLARFVEAQSPVFEIVLAELRSGRKRTHWMWFIFPQLAVLGHSTMAKRYGLSGREEAQAYQSHPLLGPRLIECAELVLQNQRGSIADMLGHPDDLKFRSCMTLFAVANPGQPVFQQCLDHYFSGNFDPLTLKHLTGEAI